LTSDVIAPDSSRKRTSVVKMPFLIKVELRLKGQPASAGVPVGIYPASQIVITPEMRGKHGDHGL
jgi:hypothetical protein